MHILPRLSRLSHLPRLPTFAGPSKSAIWILTALQEDEQLARLRASMDLGPRPFQSTPATSDRRDEIEGGYGGQEDLEDRYATTSGEH